MHGERGVGGDRGRKILAYFIPLTLLLYVVDPTGPFFDILVTYLLKDRLHATLAEAAGFRLLVAIPVYGAVVFGMIRDRWSPFARRDRGYMLLFGAATALCLFGLSLAPLTVTTVTCGVIAVMVLTRFIVAAYQGLMALIAQENALSGRLAVVWQMTAFATALAGSACSGLIAERWTPSSSFVLLAVAACLIAALAVCKPAAVYSARYDVPPDRTAGLRGDLRTLWTHKAALPAVLAMLMFQFSPGSGVVLQYYLVDVLHGTDAQYGFWYAVFLGSFMPVMLVYAQFCQRLPFGRLLWWSAVLAIPQGVPLLFIHSPEGALWMAIPMGMLGGFMWTALHDLAMRSCPSGLHGTLMMVISGVNALGLRCGDLAGAWIYGLTGGRAGFTWCVVATTLMYAAILWVIRSVPADITQAIEGRPERRALNS
jgi:MFS family permease